MDTLEPAGDWPPPPHRPTAIGLGEGPQFDELFAFIDTLDGNDLRMLIWRMEHLVPRWTWLDYSARPSDRTWRPRGSAE